MSGNYRYDAATYHDGPLVPGACIVRRGDSREWLAIVPDSATAEVVVQSLTRHADLLAENATLRAELDEAVKVLRDAWDSLPSCAGEDCTNGADVCSEDNLCSSCATQDIIRAFLARHDEGGRR